MNAMEVGKRVAERLRDQPIVPALLNQTVAEIVAEEITAERSSKTGGTARTELVQKILGQAGKIPSYMSEINELRAIIEGALEDAATVPAGEEIVRVLRLVEYEGPRALVEEQVSRSVHGTKVFAPKRPGKEVRITAVTVGDFPEVLELARQSPEPKLLRDLRERIRNLKAQLREWAK